MSSYAEGAREAIGNADGKGILQRKMFFNAFETLFEAVDNGPFGLGGPAKPDAAPDGTADPDDAATDCPGFGFEDD